ncbi:MULTISPECIES: hypothetical protein [unclassified Ruegeria]|uniref:hypothetical protein n=1 Tax=unclassified Ruegeria TaxID=2625375 RepID=UPI00149178DE|nr:MULTISPECIES: hypothetical protein [unclassified Ruegeria]NOD35690.1 hypothetical protein [Ruegeria sp. HKCCD7296]NOE43057.1 hypothetical protein [Ruegeria sp. HKCCD7319]
MQINRPTAWEKIDTWQTCLLEAVADQNPRRVSIYSEAIATLSALLTGGDAVLELDADDAHTFNEAEAA